MLYPHRRILAALATTIPLFILAVSATGPAAAVTPAPDGLSGTWQVSRTCLTVCVSPKPVRKVVSHLQGDVFVTGSHPRQVLYRLGMQVLVHGLKDSLLLAIKTPGLLMSGFGVGADGSTFTTTWRCVAPPGITAAVTNTVTATTTATTTTTVTATNTVTAATAAAITMGTTGARPHLLPMAYVRC